MVDSQIKEWKEAARGLFCFIISLEELLTLHLLMFGFDKNKN